LQKSLAIDPTNAVAMVNLGSILRSEGKLDDAEQMYLKAVSLNPDLAEGYFNLGVLYDSYKKDKAKAIENYSRYWQLAKDRKDAVETVPQWIERLQNEKK